MEILIDKAIDNRISIRDYETALSLKWLKASNLTEVEKTELSLEILQRTC